MKTAVECYAGHRYPERPLAFTWRGERLTVEQVEGQWRTPAGLSFLVRAADSGGRFVLTYAEPLAEAGGGDWDVRRA
jgi:hypothetical protein